MLPRQKEKYFPLPFDELFLFRCKNILPNPLFSAPMPKKSTGRNVSSVRMQSLCYFEVRQDTIIFLRIKGCEGNLDFYRLREFLFIFFASVDSIERDWCIKEENGFINSSETIFDSNENWCIKMSTNKWNSLFFSLKKFHVFPSWEHNVVNVQRSWTSTD